MYVYLINPLLRQRARKKISPPFSFTHGAKIIRKKNTLIKRYKKRIVVRRDVSLSIIKLLYMYISDHSHTSERRIAVRCGGVGKRDDIWGGGCHPLHHWHAFILNYPQCLLSTHLSLCMHGHQNFHAVMLGIELAVGEAGCNLEMPKAHCGTDCPCSCLRQSALNIDRNICTCSVLNCYSHTLDCIKGLPVVCGDVKFL